MKFNGSLNALLLAPVLAAPALAQPVALVADVAGKATLEDGKALRLMDEVAAKRTLTLAPGARLVLVHMKTGEELAFAGPCKVRFNAQGMPEGAKPQVQRKVQALQGSIHLKPAALAQASVVMREAAGTRKMAVSPRGPWVLDPTPAFTWEATPKAEYHFKLTDDKGEVLIDLNLTEAKLRVPEHLAMREKAPYTWALTVNAPGEPAKTASGTLKLLGKEEREQLAKAHPKESSSFAERLLYASLLEQLGAKDAAREQWKSLSKERPEDARLRELAAD